LPVKRLGFRQPPRPMALNRNLKRLRYRHARRGEVSRRWRMKRPWCARRQSRRSPHPRPPGSAGLPASLGRIAFFMGKMKYEVDGRSGKQGSYSLTQP
jgi:hypothetical protein